MRTCEFCEDEYEPTRRDRLADRQRFCSRDCQVRAWRDREWAKRQRERERASTARS